MDTESTDGMYMENNLMKIMFEYTQCKECQGSGVIKEYDEMDRYYLHVCHICNGAGELRKQSGNNKQRKI